MTMKILPIALIATLLCGTAFAEDRKDFAVKHKMATYEDVFQDVQDAVIGQGLVIDYIGHTNAMLTRTSAVASSEKSEHPTPYLNANYVQFCSSLLTHEAVAANPYNLATCPFVIFLFETHDKPGRIAVGYRKPEMGITGPTYEIMKKADQLLNDIVAEATAD